MSNVLSPTAGEADVSAFQAFAETLADQAGGLGLQWFRTPLTIENKADESPVTMADKAIEEMIRGKIAAAFPTHGLLGEEHGRERLDACHVWVIDPIDGTRSFITGWPIWGFLLALLENGRPVLGLIDMPALKERWIGALGKATLFKAADGQVKPCQTRKGRCLAQADFYTTSPFYFAGQDWAQVERVAKAAATPRFGGDCYGYGLLASGHIDLVIEAQLQPFDYLSLIPVIEGAGGVITDWSGHPLSWESDGRVIAAATPALHAEALAVLNGV